MFAGLKGLLTEPRLWIGAGAVLFCVGLGTKYLEDQKLADAFIEQRARLPEPVFVQAYHPERHTNEFDELSVIGEVDFGAAEIVDLGVGKYVLLPVGDVTAGGRRAGERRIFEVMGQGAVMPPHRPVARSEGMSQRAPRAVLFYELGVSHADRQDLGLDELGAGFGGTVVHAAGRLVGHSPFDGPSGQMFHAALERLIGPERAGIVSLISPLPKRSGVAADHNHLSHPADWKMWIGAMLILTGSFFFVQSSGRPIGRRRIRGKSAIEAISPPSLPSPGGFAPIASQDELSLERSRPASFRGAVADRFADFLGRVAGHAASFRNRP